MAKEKRSRDQKRKQKLAKRKQKARPVTSLAYMGEKYKTDELIPFWLRTETGIYESYVMTDRKLLDQTVANALEKLIKQLRSGTLLPLTQEIQLEVEAGHEEDLIILNIQKNWESYYDDHLPLSREKVIGVLRTILGSLVKVRSPDPLSQAYLRHIAVFLTKKIGVSVKQFSVSE